MVFPVQQFRPLTMEEVNPQYAGLQKGLQTAGDIFTMGRSALQLPEQMQLAKMVNELKKLELQHQPKEYQQADALKGLQIRKMEQELNDPMARLHLTGVAAEALGLERIKRQFGQDSDIYKNAKRSLDAKIGSLESLATLRSDPRRYSSPEQKRIYAFEDQLKLDHPEWNEDQIRQAANAYIMGQDQIDDQTQLPPLAGQSGQYLADIYKNASPVALQNQAANLNNAVSELNNVNLNPIKEFTGAKGTLKYNAMKTGAMKRTPSWYAYDAFKNSGAIKIMDDLRNALKTSIVPDYVYQTLGKLSNPNDPIWGDPEQVQTRWNTTLRMLENQAKNATKQARHGATVRLNEEKNVQREISKGLMSQKDPSQMTDAEIQAELGG